MKKQKLILFDIDYTLFNTDVFKETQLKKHSVYNEVERTLNELSKIARLGIFSEGKIDLQKRKLQKTAIQKYFPKEQTHIVLEKGLSLKEVLNQYQNFELFLVDDKLTILGEAKNYMPSIFTIWVKRGKYAQKQKEIPGFKSDATVINLKQIIKIIREKK